MEMTARFSFSFSFCACAAWFFLLPLWICNPVLSSAVVHVKPGTIFCKCWQSNRTGIQQGVTDYGLASWHLEECMHSGSQG